jgi:phage gp16-like protein
MPTPDQIKKIHALKRALGLDDETYRLRLDSFGASSCKDLTEAQISRLIEVWEKQAIAAGAWKQFRQQPGRKKYDERKHRVDMATAPQLRMIEALWDQVSRAEKSDRAMALNKLIRRIVKKDRIEFLTAQDVQRLVKTLEAMGAERAA